MGTTPDRFRVTELCTLCEKVEGNVQGEDEAKPKEQDTKMSAPSASQLEPEEDFAPPPDAETDYALAPHVQEQIGRRLAAVYDEVLRQPIPERFLLLLDQLDESTKTAKERSSTKETEID